MPLEYLYSAMQMEKYSGAASIEVVSFTLCTVPPLSVFVFYRPRYLFPFPFLFFSFLLSLLALPSLCPEFFCSLFSLSLFLFLPSLIRSRLYGCTYLACNNDGVIGSTPPRTVNTENLFLVRGVSSINTCCG